MLTYRTVNSRPRYVTCLALRIADFLAPALISSTLAHWMHVLDTLGVLDALGAIAALRAFGALDA